MSMTSAPKLTFHPEAPVPEFYCDHVTFALLIIYHISHTFEL